jgi:hypothetical protein
MEIQGREQIAAKSEPGIHGSSKIGDGAGLASDHEFRSSEIRTSGLTAVVNDGASSSALAPRATGPRTPNGKDRSKHNALKHGIFSKMVLLKGEPRSDFDSLLSGLRDALRPEGMLEQILVEKLVSLIWRQRRLLMAEGAEIRLGTEFVIYSISNVIEDMELESRERIAEKKKLNAIARSVPYELDRLLRYEASLERAFDLTLSQLERHQRMRLGQAVPPPIHLRVTTSND